MMTMWVSMNSIQKAQTQTHGRHSGWITITDCRTVINSTYAQNGYPTSTMSDIKDLVERHLSQGLLETKHCDAESGVQQYIRVSSDYDDLKAFVVRQGVFKESREAAEYGSARKWWTKNEQGNYHPDGPSEATRKRYKPIIESFWKGLRVKERGIDVPCIVEQDRM
jgi:hypothetical protein